MTFLPLDRMLERVDRYGADSDSALFTELLYAGEFILKTTTAIVVSAIEDDQENHRYRLIHGLVRADGLGDWVKALDEALTGATSQHLTASFSDSRRALTERFGRGEIQHSVVSDLHSVLTGVDGGAQAVSDKVSLSTWFQLFVQLRNKTRGHGAPTPATCSKLVTQLRASIRGLCALNPIFELSYAYLHRNLSGKYRIVPLGGDSDPFKSLSSAKAASGHNYLDGVYIWAEKFRLVELIHSDLDVSDFLLPNGAFNNKTFELHSLITDNRLKGDATQYLMAIGERPSSETEGKNQLDILGNTFSNLPNSIPGYVSRPQLEKDVQDAFTNDRHPIVTLVGRGGIGKTSVALTILHKIAQTVRYNVIVWFSARDIDLMMAGAKAVQPHLLTDRDIAEEYRTLMGGPKELDGKKQSAITYMAEHLRSSPLGPTLYIFDNFETVRSPVDLFEWIDLNIRLPNKAVITTRFRDFKADYPIDVMGMEQEEAETLVERTAASLGIDQLIGTKERNAIIEQSDGHPYVIKIMLGEIANERSFSKPLNLIARKEDILDALFERTYANLSPIASRIYLTLSAWRSLVPQLAVEAVMLRHGVENVDPEAGIEQLLRMSLIERISASDNTDFLAVPLTAALFAARKLKVNPNRTVIEDDIRFLQDIGATTISGLKDGIRPRLEAFFKKTARRISEGTTDYGKIRPVLEFLAHGYPPAWLLLSELEEEMAAPGEIHRAAEWVRRYLETQPPEMEAGPAWQRLTGLYRGADDVIGGCGAFLKAAETIEPPLDEISNVANWLNRAAEIKSNMDTVERKPLFGPLAALLERHLDEATATDLSRLAWLHLHSGDAPRALVVANLGLDREPNNTYCQRLVDRLSQSY